LDKDGYIVNPSGDNLQGYGVDEAGEVEVGAVGNLQVSTANSKPSPTSKAQMQLLLDSRLPVVTNTPFNPEDAKTYSSTTITSIYDKQGTSHEFKTYYVKSAIGTWDVYSSTDGFDTNTIPNPANPLPPGAPATIPVKGATFHFSQDGRLDNLKTYIGTTIDPNFPLGRPVNPSAAQTRITFSIPYTDSSGAPDASFDLDVTQTAQYASDFLASTQQDGYPTGQFLNVTVDKEGTLFANYSSGQSEKVGRVVLATFPSEINLAQDRNNQFVKTTASGDPTINSPGKGGTGQVLGGNIETAGVDLTSEMIKLISAQRTYQANSEVVKRQDQVMQTIIGIGQ
jgi:flagellar hook protein FlgE